MAGRDKMGVVADTLPNLGRVLRAGWHFFVPFALLLLFLFHFRMNAPEAALYAALAMLVIGFVRPYEGTRAGIGDLFRGLASAGLNTVELIAIVAAAGFVIGILNSTGGGFALSLAMIQLGGGNLLALLLIGGLICIVLGMGMPTAGVYVLLAALIAPAIVQAGVEPLAAHMFILYFGMMSMITPPIALACFAAATITGASPMQTGIAAMRFGWVAYIVPFLFVLSPSLLMIGDPMEVAFAALTAALGVGFITIAVVGFLFSPLKPLFRLAFLVAGITTLTPASLMQYGSFIDISGAALGIALVIANRLLVPGAQPSASFR